MMRTRALVMVSVLLCAAALPALAAPVPAAPGPAVGSPEAEVEAKRLYGDATKSFQLGEFGPAIEGYKAAYKLVPKPFFIYNIAQAYRLMGDFKQALFFYRSFLNALPDAATRWRAMCEINAIEQVRNVARTTLVADAWKRGQSLVLHGWIYGLEDGRLKDLQTALKSGPELDLVIDQAVQAVHSRYLNASEA